MSATVDIVVPVYRGEAETRACLESVLASAGRVAFEVVVVDDASPEPAISAWLRVLRDAGRITLIAHAGNRGFVASVNDGMRLHPDRDVVLLNSDTEVAPGWLDRLTAHAAADPAIGTATPFSSNATICSYPITLAPNAIPAGETTASLDDVFAHANAHLAADIPTGVGFCMHVTRRCLDAVGLFDEARYGMGYGEEVDFCMRAARAGFRNVVAGDVFVRHVGEVSFGGTGLERRAQAQAMVDGLYPEFQVKLREYLAADRLRPFRERADLERLRRATRPLALVIAASDAAAVEPIAGHETLLLRAVAPTGASLRWLRAGEAFALEGDAARIAAALQDLAIEQVVRAGALALPAEVEAIAIVRDALQAARARDVVEGLRARERGKTGFLDRLRAWARGSGGRPE